MGETCSLNLNSVRKSLKSERWCLFEKPPCRHWQCYEEAPSSGHVVLPELNMWSISPSGNLMEWGYGTETRPLTGNWVSSAWHWYLRTCLALTTGQLLAEGFFQLSPYKSVLSVDCTVKVSGGKQLHPESLSGCCLWTVPWRFLEGSNFTQRSLSGS